MSGAVGSVASLVASALAGGGFVAIVNAVARRRTVKADATEKLTDSALKMLQVAGADANEAYKEASEARQEAAEARRETGHARREVAQLSAEVDALAAKMHRLLGWIHDPYMSIDRLRVLAPMPPMQSTNGTGATH